MFFNNITSGLDILSFDKIFLEDTNFLVVMLLHIGFSMPDIKIKFTCNDNNVYCVDQ